MSVTNVYHKSRDRIYKMNFSASGETTWAFTAESDGEIYDVESNNVASYTINGGAVTLPFSITAGNNYNVSIVKTNVSQAADITLKSRRAVEKTTTQYVPDYSANDGRYLFCLLQDDTIAKIDTELLKSANWDDSNKVYTVSPIVASLALPLPIYSEGYSHRFMQIVFNIADGYFYIIGGIGGTTTDYAVGRWVKFVIGRLDLNLNLTSLDGISNEYSYYNTNSNNNVWSSYNGVGCFPGAFINYINNELILGSFVNFSANANENIIINLIDGTSRQIPPGTAPNVSLRGLRTIRPLTNEIYGVNAYFNGALSEVGIYSGARVYQVLHDLKNNVGISFPADNGAYYTLRKGDYPARTLPTIYPASIFGAFLRQGENHALIVSGHRTSSNNWNQQVLIQDRTSGNGYYGLTLVEQSISFTTTNWVAASNYSGLFLLTLSNNYSLATTNNSKMPYLVVLDGTKAFDLTISGQHNGLFDVGFLQLPSNIEFLATNQLL